MKNHISFDRPDNLEKDKTYYLRLSITGERIPLFTEVSFLEYTGCPAVVVVQDARNAKMRCNREDLFLFNTKFHSAHRRNSQVITRNCKQ